MTTRDSGAAAAFRSWGPVRAIVLGGALVAAALSVGYLLRLPLATGTWPLPVTPLTYDFLGSYTLASTLTLLWIAKSGELAALAPLGLTTAIAYGGIVATLIPLAAADSRLWVNVALSSAILVVGLVGLVYGLRQPVRDRRLTPRPLLTFYVFAAVPLLALGLPLVMGVADVLPWNVDVQNGALLGWFFVASAVYFLFPLARRGWPYATGQLASLVAYDAILALPLILHWPVARPEHLLVLAMYITFVVSTLFVGLYIFLVHRRFRWGSTG